MIAGILVAGGMAWGQRLPEGNTGLASKYKLDEGIDKDPAVVFTEGFESGETRNEADHRGIVLRDKWNNMLWPEEADLITNVPENVHSGRRALEFTLATGTEKGEGMSAHFAKGYDVLFVRDYVKFEKDDDFNNPAHDGVCIAAVAEGFPFNSPGVRADGRNKFMASLDTWHPTGERNAPPPGRTEGDCRTEEASSIGVRWQRHRFRFFDRRQSQSRLLW